MKEELPLSPKHQENPTSRLAFWLWLVAAVSAVLVAVVISTAWAVRHVLTTSNSRLSDAQSRAVMTVAEFPGLVIRATRELQWRLVGDPAPMLIDRSTAELPQWLRRFPAPEDSGYLLFSGLDPVAKHSVVTLLRISDGRPVAHWDPDWQAISAQSTSRKFAPTPSPDEARAFHPLLLDDGDIIFNTGAALVRLTPCGPTPLWVLDETLHHSNELDTDGKAVWVPSATQDGLADFPWLRDRVRDDALALVSVDGRLLERRSFSRILFDNDLQALLLGTTGLRVNDDPVHINQITAAPRDTRHWQRGDLLISARHLSTVFLYRPSTGRILWYQTGPWMNQHSADFVDDHRISVFNNNALVNAPDEHAFLGEAETNGVYVYDFETGQLSQPFAGLLAKARPLSITEGRARILPDGGLFFEETNRGRHLRFTWDRLLWSRINDYDGKRIGIVSWSRYLTADEARAPLRALASRICPGMPSAVK